MKSTKLQETYVLTQFVSLALSFSLSLNSWWLVGNCYSRFLCRMHLKIVWFIILTLTVRVLVVARSCACLCAMFWLHSQRLLFMMFLHQYFSWFKSCLLPCREFSEASIHADIRKNRQRSLEATGFREILQWIHATWLWSEKAWWWFKVRSLHGSPSEFLWCIQNQAYTIQQHVSIPLNLMPAIIETLTHSRTHAQVVVRARMRWNKFQEGNKGIHEAQVKRQILYSQKGEKQDAKQSREDSFESLSNSREVSFASPVRTPERFQDNRALKRDWGSTEMRRESDDTESELFSTIFAAQVFVCPPSSWPPSNSHYRWS